MQHPPQPEPFSDTWRRRVRAVEPPAQRTYTPSLAVLAKSAGVFHWTPEGRPLYDFTSGVLVANLGHQPSSWLQRFHGYLGWTSPLDSVEPGFVQCVPLTAYNAVTPLEVEASERLLALMRSRPGGQRCERVLWAASGSEAIQKALWAALNHAPARPLILATRHGFHGKKGLAGAVTGTEHDPERDPRVHFISFPQEECADLRDRGRAFDPSRFQDELEQLLFRFGQRLGTLITEPYLGGGGSFHPPPAYLQMLQSFCRENDVLFILDEVQANFGRTGAWFAYESYGLEPDLVVLGKGLGNGVPVAAVAGRGDILDRLAHGTGSDTWSANPISAAAVLATLDEFAAKDVIGQARSVSKVMEAGLERLRELPFIRHLRGEADGMVWGIEFGEHRGRTANEMANAGVLAAYQGDPARAGLGVHLLGPLAGRVVRVAPPLVITAAQATESTELLWKLWRNLT